MINEKNNKTCGFCGSSACKYYIFYDHNHSRLDAIDNNTHETYNTIYFDSEKVANNAIMLYRDELIWYFTEYKDSL